MRGLTSGTAALPEASVNTRTIAIIALIVAVLLVLFLFVF